ncbi:MAG: hypothetical protein ABIN89_21930 [Chitinophagaceae bacterium]
MQDPKGNKANRNELPADNENIEEHLAELVYPANEDILNPSNSSGRVDLDVDNITRAGAGSGTVKTNEVSLENLVSEDDDDELGITPGTEADVTKEDLLSLGSIDRDMDMGEDEDLQNKGFPLGLTGSDLDVPGEELDDADEEIGEEDEENNYYSLGGDSKDSLEEDAS